MAAPVNQILIVEPDEDLARQIGEIAKNAAPECQLIFCKEGYKAVVRMESTPPLVVVTGHELHKSYPGRKLAEHIFQARGLEATAIVVVGGAAFEGIGSVQMATGQLQFLPKPVRPEELEKAVGRAATWGRTTGAEFQVKVLQAGQRLFEEGAVAEHAYLLKKGKLRAYVARENKTQTLGEILPGEFVGEMSYIDGEPRSASVDALEPSEVIEIPLRNLDAIVATKPAWSKALLKTLSRRLKGANKLRAA